jgi:hypothetical protein
MPTAHHSSSTRWKLLRFELEALEQLPPQPSRIGH